MFSNKPRLYFSRLSVGNYEGACRKNIGIPLVISDKIHWKYLRSISLHAVMSTERYLSDILQNNAENLRTLQLTEILLLEDTDDTGNIVHGSWINFIEFLHQKMSLEHVRLNSALHTINREGWLSHYQPGVSYPDGCLKFNLERYITHQGAFPLTARTDDWTRKCDPYHNLPWAYKADASWKYWSSASLRF